MMATAAGMDMDGRSTATSAMVMRVAIGATRRTATGVEATTMAATGGECTNAHATRRLSKRAPALRDR